MMKCIKVRKCLSLALISSMIFLFGCGGQVAADTSDGSETASGTETTQETGAGDTSGGSLAEQKESVDGPAHESGGRQFEILDVRDNYLLVCELGKEYGLYTVGHGPVQKDENGKDIQISDLLPGMIAELGWNGMVEESYPAKFTYDSLRLTGRTGNKEFTLYTKILKELAEKDEGLNDGIGASYFDFTSVGSLTAEEKEGLAYIAGGYFGGMGTQATAEELAEEGILDRDKGIENGILITIEEISREENRVELNARKYRSGTGAYYFNDVKAEYKDGEWTYQIGFEAIS